MQASRSLCLTFEWLSQATSQALTNRLFDPCVNSTSHVLFHIQQLVSHSDACLTLPPAAVSIDCAYDHVNSAQLDDLRDVCCEILHSDCRNRFEAFEEHEKCIPLDGSALLLRAFIASAVSAATAASTTWRTSTPWSAASIPPLSCHSASVCDRGRQNRESSEDEDAISAHHGTLTDSEDRAGSDTTNARMYNRSGAACHTLAEISRKFVKKPPYLLQYRQE